MKKRLKIDINKDELTVTVQKYRGLNALHIYILLLLGGISIAIFVFMIDMILYNDATLGAKAIFSIFIGLMLWSGISQFQDLILFLTGEDELKIDKTWVVCESKFGFFKQKTVFKVDDTVSFKMNEGAGSIFSVDVNMVSKIRYGTIVISKNRKQFVRIGHALEREELHELYEAIREKIPAHLQQKAV